MPDLFSNNSLKYQKAMLELARTAILAHLKGAPNPAWDIMPELSEKHGCFVTLRKKGELRGCVGTFDDAKPLGENLVRMAVAAAFQDGRFPAIQASEIPDLRLEISILGPLKKIDSLDEIELGKHGVYVRLAHRGGTYLPDVAVEQKWSVPEFVTHCAREKARLSPEECAKADVYRYEVLKFSEK